MQKTIERQQQLARIKFRISPKQVETVIVNNVQRGINAPYAELLNVLRNYFLNDDNFRNVIEDCLNCVVLLGKNLKPFVDAVCDLDWYSRSEDLLELYSRFLLNLVTAHTYHCPKVLANLVKAFKGIWTLYIYELFIIQVSMYIGNTFCSLHIIVQYTYMIVNNCVIMIELVFTFILDNLCGRSNSTKNILF